MNEAKLTAYLKRGKQLFDGELIEGKNKKGETIYNTLDDREGYKAAVIADLARARDAVLTGKDGWPDLVKNGLDCNLSDWRPRQAITQWLDRQPEDARAALREFWAEGDILPEKRIDAFVAKVPRDDNNNFKGTGTKLREVSVLLMAFPEGYPPFKSTEFNTAYKYMEYETLPSRTPEGAMYRHALDFIDQIVARAKEQNLERPKDRLDAQSLVWTMHGFLENGMIKPPPPKGTDNPDPLTEPLAALGEKLFLRSTSFLSETVWPLLKDKKQIIFQGPPGTGKTYVAQKLAEFLAGSEDRVELVQFHPSYAYEDFVQGFRPTLEGGSAGFAMRNGPLLRMAKQAFEEPNEKHFLVIDEINRGNLAKVFGELYFLLEYRGKEHKMRLQYSNTEFWMPENLYIIGTMNTADRSIALLDAALRRRFYFVPFHPDKEPIRNLLRDWLDREAKKWPDKWPDEQKWLPGVVERANEKLGDQRRDAAIGPSYFMKKDGLDQKKLERIWEYNVLPYIEEQLYGNNLKIEDFALDKLKRAPAGQPETGAGATGTTTANEPAPQPNPATTESDAADGD